jgi:hypothetical protein
MLDKKFIVVGWMDGFLGASSSVAITKSYFELPIDSRVN